MQHHSQYSREKKEADKGEQVSVKTNSRIALVSLFVAIASMLLTAIIGIIFSPNASQFQSLLGKQDRLLTKDSALVELYRNELDRTRVLLAKTDRIISLSESQLYLNRKEQEITNRNAGYANTANEGKFWVACQQLQLLEGKINAPLKEFYKNGHKGIEEYWDSVRLPYIIEVAKILKSQLDNPFLLSDNDMFDDWVRGYRLIATYDYMYNTSDNEIGIKDGVKKEFSKCLVAIGYLTQHTNLYMSFKVGDKLDRPISLQIKTYKDAIKHLYGKTVKEAINQR